MFLIQTQKVRAFGWRFSRTFAQAAEIQQEQQLSDFPNPSPAVQTQQQTVFEDSEHNLKDESISGPAWRTLTNLRMSGHEALIVGGTIRDLLLENTPKDFDILTSAELVQVKRLFGKCQLIGKRFPIAQVHIGGQTIEVSNWSTGNDDVQLPDDAASIKTKLDKGELGLKQTKIQLWSKCRQYNALLRDFTVNALLYEPFSRLIFDYVGGMSDIRSRTLRTVIDPYLSFMEDPARMLRAIRLAARVGLKFEHHTAAAIKQLGSGILTLPALRLTMEMNSLMAYGSAAESIKIMWHFNILEQLLPMHAAYLAKENVSKEIDVTDIQNSNSSTLTPESSASSAPAASPDQESNPTAGSEVTPISKTNTDENFLISLLSEVDKSVHTSSPADPALYMAVLACPLIVDKIQVLNQGLDAEPEQEQQNTNENQEQWQSIQPLPMVQIPKNYRDVVTSVMLDMVRSTPAGFEVILPYGAAGDAVDLLLEEYAARVDGSYERNTRKENTMQRLDREFQILRNALAVGRFDWHNKTSMNLNK
eukprot:TRINITY_DN9096_c0_g2_i3.p1 TRINITY_DN9096_c0_g2~~TRINITY_DN9096_c0_g2_i3.p1  ORF type:complete len:560 (+),score=49.85 TRINITY_DN9096_c0_g2_i3:79-1680(+)